MKKTSPKNSNARVEVNNVLLHAGFRNFKILSESFRHLLLLVTKGASSYVVKAAHGVEARNQRNEAYAHEMLNRLVPPNARFTFPEMEVLEDGDVFVSVQPFIPEKYWYAAKKTPLALHRKIGPRELEDVFQVVLFLHTLPHRKLTRHFQRAGKEYTLANRLAMHETYLKPAIGTLCSEKEADRLTNLLLEVGYQRRFVHHDIGPSNMAINPKNGSTLFTDAEFARWGTKWYDVAYSFLQLALLHNQGPLAKRWLTHLVRRFKEELPNEDIEREIFFPLAFWIAANMSIAMQQEDAKHRQRVRDMFELILKRDLKAMMGA